MSSDLHYLSLDEVARRLKARKLSSVEATQAILDRIDKLDPGLKSYATVTPERALQDAVRLDAETAAGKSRGTLHGVPIAVKDLCNTAGVPTAAGMAIHRQHVPAKDATVVARLKQAGAVILALVDGLSLQRTFDSRALTLERAARACEDAVGRYLAKV